jgi:aspartate beta-hydroxylase
LTLPPPMSWTTDPRLARAHEHARRGEVLQAASLYRALLDEHPACAPAARALAAFALDRGDFEAADALLAPTARLAPDDVPLRFEHAQVQWQLGRPEDALASFEAIVRRDPSHHVAWLMLGELRLSGGDTYGALKAGYQAVTRAQKAGEWISRETTDPALLELVMRQIDRLRQGRRELLFESYRSVREAYGGYAVARVDRALTGYLGEWDATPADPRQRPKFLYFPDLPPGPYHDPYLHEWAPRWRDAWLDIRAEAMALLADDRDFESFLGLKPGQKADGYVGGTNPNASWDAYFFYRHGERYAEHHARCPRMSGALDSIELCRIAHQAPEVCFSVIRPQTTIMAHHGSTNTRLVMHLPLIVPRDCALHVIGHGEHHWKEGELMMFDDTFLHEAWNRSDEPRLIVLMDCWNPHLTEPEKAATRLLVEAIDAFENR